MRGPFDDLGAQMLASRGKLLVDVTEMLSGKAIPNKASGVLSWLATHRWPLCITGR
jgi:hypothetical protein